MAKFTVDFVTDERLRVIAEGYLARQHPDGSLPIPIEEIIDLKERIDIIAIEDLSVYGHQAFPARDRKTIYVDQEMYLHKNPNRLRFTLAHELAHIILHGPVFEAADYTSVKGWKAFLASIGDAMLKRLEAQAFTLGGLLLVPSTDLSREYTAMAEKLAEAGLDITALPPEALKQVAKQIGGHFQVSWQVIHRRAVKENLWAWDAIQAA